MRTVSSDGGNSLALRIPSALAEETNIAHRFTGRIAVRPSAPRAAAPAVGVEHRSRR